MELSEIKTALINKSKIHKGDMGLGNITECSLWYDSREKQFRYTVVSRADNAVYRTLIDDVEVYDNG